MGRSVKDDVNPRKFLKGREKTDAGVDPRGRPRPFRREADAKKPGVPKRDERPVYGLKSTKNFVVANAVENILAAPKVRDTAEADYLAKADYGQVPAYLGEVQKEIEAEKEYVRQLFSDQGAVGGPAMKEMPEDEREMLLDALKEKWDSVNKVYQAITHKRISSSTSTAGAIRRKENCEKELAQLEKDIQRLSVKGPILVVDEQQDYGYY